jgi:hypothetical protein
MVKQNPGTTVHNLVLAGRRLKVAESINQPDLVQGSRSALRGLGPGGEVRPEAANPTIPFQVVSWYVEGSVVADTSIERELRLPQLSRPVRLYADAKGAPTVGSFVADLYSNGVFVDNVSIRQGEDSGFSELTTPLPAFARLRVAIVTAAGAQSVTISLVYQPYFE